MKIKKAEYLRGAVKKNQYPPEEYPEIALVGRSNVGKSSLLNKLVNQKKQAHTSSEPGKTRIINFYLINGSFILVDLPGYGFASVSAQRRERWQLMVEEYLRERKTLKGIIMLLDLRHSPSQDDIAMAVWLKYYSYPTLFVTTKADKVPRGHRREKLETLCRSLGLEKDEPVLFSAATGEGKEELLKRLGSFLDSL